MIYSIETVDNGFILRVASCEARPIFGGPAFTSTSVHRTLRGVFEEIERILKEVEKEKSA
jgi:hypothetical protein